MKKNFNKILLSLVVMALAFTCFVGFNSNSDKVIAAGNNEEFIDYASQLKLDMNSSTAKAEVTVATLIDGDTTHFHVDKSVDETGILKGRYLAIDTPESTGLVEPYGNKAKNFTNDRLRNAVSIVVESNTAEWNKDSTGSRMLVFVWYKKDANSDYRNLNLEILQEGLAKAKAITGNLYDDVCKKAYYQAQAFKLNIHSGEPDPDYYYGSAIEITLKELRLNCENYKSKKVAFEGVVTRDVNNGVYIEEFDEETGVYFGIYCYYGFNLDGFTLKALSIGNRIRVVGTLQYYDAGQSWQVSGLSKYDLFDTENPENIQLISSGNKPAYKEVSGETFTNGIVSVEVDGALKNVKYTDAAMNSTISMNNLKVEKAYTTDNGGKHDGALTLTCKAPDGKNISVRTEILKDGDGSVIKADRLNGKTINVKGIIDTFKGKAQIKVVSAKDIEIPGEVFPLPKPDPKPQPKPDTKPDSESKPQSSGCSSSVGGLGFMPVLVAMGTAVLLKKRKFN